jgi:hypothetical protein
MQRTWTLIGPDGKAFISRRPGTLGGGYVRQRVFFLNRTHARAAGYRPCARCLPKEYAEWKSTGRR